jgi:hypothetical protein
MSGYAAKQWSQFLHGTQAGRVLDQMGQFGKGLGEEVGGLVEGLWTYGPLRAAIDPDGSYQSWEQLVDGMAPLAGLGGEHAPGVGTAWKDLGKAVTHWDEWQANPAEAAGKSTFDIATLFAPGGAAAAAGKGGRAAADAAEAAEAAAQAGRGEAAVASRALGEAAKPAAAPGAPVPAPHPPRIETPPTGRSPSPPDKPASPMPPPGPHAPAVDGHPLPPQPPPPPPHDGVPAHDPHGPHPAGDGPPGEYHHSGQHDYLPQPYTPSDVAVEAAHRTYERAAAAEPGISPAVVDAVGDAGGHLERFDSRLKEIDSLARKLDDKLEYVDPSNFERIHAAENSINDAVRYTAVVPEHGYWSHGDAVIKALEERGFALKYDPGCWKVPDVYRGRNLTFQTPDGVQFEVQIHTGDSLSAAEQTHPMYEERRLRTTSPERKAELEALQAEIFNSVPIPDGTPLRWRDP